MYGASTGSCTGVGSGISCGTRRWQGMMQISHLQQDAAQLPTPTRSLHRARLRRYAVRPLKASLGSTSSLASPSDPEGINREVTEKTYTPVVK